MSLWRMSVAVLLFLAYLVGNRNAFPAAGEPDPIVIQPAPAAVVDQKLVEQGRALYLKSYCGICHTLPAAGTNGKFGPTHDHIATTAQARVTGGDYTGDAQTAEAYLRESITTPTAYLVPGFANSPHPMPSYAHLDKADLDAIVYFLLQQH